jgi:drug/metabolite transporter (DMT)-like permease
VAGWVFYSLVGRQVMKTVQPMAAVTYSCLIGASGLLPLALMETPLGDWQTISPDGWTALLYLGFFGTAVGFTWYYQGIKAVGPARAGVFINFVPISAIIMAWLILGETVDLSLVMGAALVITGVVLVNRKISGNTRA